MLGNIKLSFLFQNHIQIHRDRLKIVQILLSRTQAGPGRKVKQEQGEIFRNRVQSF